MKTSQPDPTFIGKFKSSYLASIFILLSVNVQIYIPIIIVDEKWVEIGQNNEYPVKYFQLDSNQMPIRILHITYWYMAVVPQEANTMSGRSIKSKSLSDTL